MPGAANRSAGAVNNNIVVVDREERYATSRADPSNGTLGRIGGEYRDRNNTASPVVCTRVFVSKLIQLIRSGGHHQNASNGMAATSDHRRGKESTTMIIICPRLYRRSGRLQIDMFVPTNELFLPH